MDARRLPTNLLQRAAGSLSWSVEGSLHLQTLQRKMLISLSLGIIAWGNMDISSRVEEVQSLLFSRAP